MKKYIISTAIMLTAVASVFAQQGAVTQPSSMPVTGAPMMMPPTITTGDATTDAKIKALQTEMEAKIKAIRDEYQAKIKALIGDKKVNMGNDMRNRGSSTLRMEGRKEKRDGMKGSSTMMHEDMNETMDHREGGVPKGGMVKGESAGNKDGERGNSEQAGLRGFFNKLFGR